MSDNNAVDLDKEVDFAYPEGLTEAAKALDFLPDDGTREALLAALVASMNLW
ncbi:MAG: hypothetical protein LBU61_01520 [Coriobacteriales bacterium]|jgi:hypothetical protein|nr:hypothetical protein [Coriobacteriales bacterium]